MPRLAVKSPSQKEIINHLDSLPNFTLRSKDMYKDSAMYEKIAKDLKKAEETLIELNADLNSLRYDELENQKDYFPAYNEAKQNLKKTRQGLRRLAHRTVSEVRALKILLAALDESNDLVLLKVSIAKMKKLMIETMKTLQEALDSYNSAQVTIENLNSNIKTTNELLAKIVATNTPPFCSKSYSDPFTYFFSCQALRFIWNTFYPSIPKLRVLTTRMEVQGTLFDKTIHQAMAILTEEIELINEWSVSAEVVNQNIDDYSEEFLKKYIAIRTTFVNGLDDLQKNAEEFLAQPVDFLA